jgi:hypothetical protein
MIHVLVNGVQVELPAQASSSLRDLLTEIRAGYSTETSLISSILVNGIEIDAQDESAIGGVKLSELRSLEVFTAHPKEIAEETLQSLIEYSNHLESLCENTAKLLLEVPSKTDLLPKLADGVTTFIDALTNVKLILHVGALNKIQILEADLLSILKDMLDYQRKSEFAFVGTVIRDALIPNLETWRLDGIPSLIRLRDS